MWLVDGLLAAAALAGHWAIVLFFYCRMYAHVTAKWMVWPTRLTFWALAFVPPGLGMLWWLGPGRFDPMVLGPPAPAILVYMILCWAALAYVLALSVRRQWRPTPAGQLANHTRLVNVAKRLGRRPVGTRAVSKLAYLPGNQVFGIQVVEKHLRFDRVPSAWRGLSIVQLSDLHAGRFLAPEFYHECFRIVDRMQPDLLVLTGDVSDEPDRVPDCLAPLAEMNPRMGKIATCGNHDYWRGRDAVVGHLRRIGFTVLDNRVEVRQVAGHPLAVAGISAPWCKEPLPTLDRVDPEAFRLCLSHTPDNIPWAREAGIDLMLCGHVHGGQIRIPLVGAMYCPSRFGRRYDAGLFQEGPMLVYVNRGLSGSLPLRYGCRPEITRLVLYPADETDATPK